MKKYVKVLAILVLFLTTITYSPPTETVSATDTPYYVQLGGEPFGIRLFSDGVLVIKVEEKLCGDKEQSPAFEAGIKKNDIIKKVNSENIYSSYDLTEAVKRYSDLELTIQRNGETHLIKTSPKCDKCGNPKLGIWVKDSSAGIGTVTYYDDNKGIFGTLGHGIYESETGTIMPLYYGEITKANIYDVTKSVNGKAGTLNGYFEDEIIGKAYKNSDVGIFGRMTENQNKDYIETASKGEVNLGDALIYTTVKGCEKKAYNIKIKRLNTHSDKGMLIEITDPELLEVTGGITQGMSGSPIVQNGKLVGALTHVLINNVEYGYGIYIEDMMKSA